MKGGVEYLYAAQNDAGNWESVSERNPDAGRFEVNGAQWGGLTAMSTTALLSAGESPRDPRVMKAIKFLIDKPMVGTYAISYRCQALSMLTPDNPEHERARRTMRGDLKALLNPVSDRKSPGFGFYTYVAGAQNDYDRSNSHFAVLGVWALQQAGLDVPKKYWQLQKTVWEQAQNPDGGWGYVVNKESTANMTAAGVTALCIIREGLAAGAKGGAAPSGDKRLEAALKWIDKDRAAHSLGANQMYYALSAYLRAAMFSGRKSFAERDVNVDVSDLLLRMQNQDGSYGGGDATFSPKKIPDTVFSIVMLSKIKAQLGAPKSGSDDPVVAATPPRPAGKRLPIPPAKSLAESRKLIVEIFPGEPKTAAERLDRAHKMKAQAAETDDDPASTYVLLNRAAELSAEAGDVDGSIESLDELAGHFDVNAVALKVDMLKKFAGAGPAAAAVVAAGPHASERLVEVSLRVADDAVAATRFDDAGALADIADSAARRIRDRRLIDAAAPRAARFRSLRDAQPAVRAAEQKLKTDPQDSAAHLTLGRFYALGCGDWAKGISHLAAGSDPLLKAAASKEWTATGDAKNRLEVADAWWDAAQGNPADAQMLRRHAAAWYRQALKDPAFSGLHRAKAQKRVDDVEAGLLK